MSRVVLDGVSKSFRGTDGQSVQAVRSLGLKVETGELLVLLGPSGSGKTTVLRLIAGLEQPDAGQISMDGAVVNSVPPEKRDIAMVFQSGALYPHLTALANITLGLKLRKIPKAEADGRARETAALLGVTTLLGRLPRELSGGERQRVALARALVRRPKVLLLDEPLSNLDAPLRLQLRREIRKIQCESRVTTIHVTHDQEEALAIGDRIALMHEGRIEQVGPVEEVYNRPATPFATEFFSSQNPEIQ